MMNMKKNKEILKKYGIPTAELIWCQYYNNDSLTHIVTSGITREHDFLYEIKESTIQGGKNTNHPCTSFGVKPLFTSFFVRTDVQNQISNINQSNQKPQQNIQNLHYIIVLSV